MSEKETILAVDDNSESLSFLVSILAAEGYAVRPADSGELALASASHNPPDLILLDVRMKGMDGLEVCRHLKSNEKTAHIPIILVSAFAEVREWVEGLKHGAADYVTKPFQIPELLTRVKTHLALSRAKTTLHSQAAAIERQKVELQAEIVNRQAAEAEAKRRAEDTRRADTQSAYHRCLIEASVDPIVTIGPDGKITDVNLATETATGLSREKLIGTDFSDYFTEPERAGAGYQQVFREGIVRDYALNLKHRNGHLMPVLYNASVYRDEAGRVIGVLAAARDISKRKQAEEDRIALERKLHQAQKAESLTRMAGAIAHHYNNLLGVIIGNLEIIQDEMTVEPGLEGCLTDALAAAKRAAEVSGLMLTYLGQVPNNRESVDLSEAVSGSLSWFRERIPETLILETELPFPGPIVAANIHQLHRIAKNLLLNAREALGEKPGTIRLSVRTVLPADIRLTHSFPLDWQPGNHPHACLEVADTGCGIAEQDIQKLFDPFFSSKFTGRGLGLPVVIGVARAYRGGVTVVSEPGHGSVFQVFLPVSEKETPENDAV